MPKSKFSDAVKCTKLIELVRDQPVLYDPLLPEYKDVAIAKNTWKSIEKTLQVDGVSWQDVRTRWRTLRDMYVKKRREIASKKKSGSKATNYTTWKYMAILNFLDRHVQEPSTYSNVVSEDTEGGIFDDSAESHTLSQEADFYDREDELDIRSECFSARWSDTSPRSSTSTLPESARSSKAHMPTPKPKKMKTEKMSYFESSFLHLDEGQSSRIEEERELQRQRHHVDAFF